ncbi:hypothetical protein niasHT_014077 [Heterodera trifolii]|uniref:ATPase AAA-type core domain-containing protein n=1 Tax=Heterodera trifolii TaxID=157864 RepID=A0ABD2LG86_9BILA
MDCFDNDDAFGELVYEEEEFEQELEDKRKQDQKCTSTQREEEEEHRETENEILPELSDDDDSVSGDEQLADDGKENANEEHGQLLLDRDTAVGQQQMARKRGPIGVFQDYSPIDWHLRIGDEEQQTKRRRMELEEAVQRATMRILSARRQHQQRHQNEPTTSAQSDSMSHNQQIAGRKDKLLRVPPMNGQVWWGINSVDGTFRRYIGTRRLAKENATTRKQDTIQLESADLAFANLMQAEERVHEREQEQRLRNSQSVQMEVDKFHSSQTLTAKRTNKFTLWADKYAPSTFLDLLTEDETNRIVLLWLRLWDEYVFEKRGGKKWEGNHRRISQRNNANATSLWDTLEERDRTLFEMERPKGTDSRMPKQKILALFGPSGVGKTSLARVAAEQAGYRPVIIPISELQNMAELKSRLENATDCTSIDALFHNLSVSAALTGEAPPPHVGTRPCCFIVDAVEQASPEMVQFLCSWVRRSRASSVVRRRPVICTCASLWHAPALRELRANCLPVRVQRCNRQRMQRRLEQICHYEGVRIGRDQLDELFLSHGSDIRLCLNTLQFSTLKTHTSDQIQANRTTTGTTTTTNANFAFVSGTTADQKVFSSNAVSSPLNTAVAVSLFDTLSAIFTLDFHTDNRGIVRPLPVRSRTLQALFGQMSSEEFVRLEQLVFNNFAAVLKLNMAQCRFVSVLFTQLDALQTLLQRAQHFVLARYIPFALAFVHLHCALHVSRRLQFNLAVQPFVEQQRENQQVMRSLRANVVTGAHCCIGLVDLFTWFAPLLWFVLQPPVKASLWSDGGGDGHEQRQMVQRVVELMRSFGINLVRTTGADGMARFAFEPAFDSAVHFHAQLAIASSANGNASSRPTVTTTPTSSSTTMHLVNESVKQYIAQQLEQTQLMTTSKKKQQVVQQQKQMVEKNNDEGPGLIHQQNWMTERRPVSPSSSSALSVQQPLFTFRHSVGSSQAVRRDIRIGTLFSTFDQK